MTTNRTLYYKTRKPRILGHRGTAGTHPENTMASFWMAVLVGADVLELDIHKTRDKHLVIMHDDTVDRTTNGTGKIADFTLAELKELDAGYWFTTDGGKTYPCRGLGYKVPELEELFETFPQMPVNIEQKVDDDELMELFVALLDHYGRLNDGSAMVVGVAHPLVKKLRKHVSTDCTGYSDKEVRRFVVLTALHLGWLFPRRGAAFQVPVQRGKIKIVTPRFIKYAHKIGSEVHVWTVNDRAEMHRLLDMGVDALFTDHPDTMMAVLQERGQRPA